MLVPPAGPAISSAVNSAVSAVVSAVVSAAVSVVSSFLSLLSAAAQPETGAQPSFPRLRHPSCNQCCRLRSCPHCHPLTSSGRKCHLRSSLSSPHWSQCSSMRSRLCHRQHCSQSLFFKDSLLHFVRKQDMDLFGVSIGKM